MMLDRRRVTIFLPVRADGADAMRANRENLFDLVLLEALQIVLSELAKRQIVAQTARRVACTSLLAQYPEADIQPPQYSSERGDDFASLWIIRPHAAKPEAIFLGAIV